MARSLSFCGETRRQAWRVAALNADAINFYTVHFTHKVEYFYGQMMKAADNSISGYGKIRRFALSLQSRFRTRVSLPACISIYMMERTISFMHDLPDNSLAHKGERRLSGERCTYLVTSTFCSMCTRCAAPCEYLIWRLTFVCALKRGGYNIMYCTPRHQFHSI